MFADALGALQVAHGAELVELVRADGLDAHVMLQFGEVAGTGGEQGHARAGERDLRGGEEVVDAFGIARGLGAREDVLQMAFLVNVMHAVGVVPEDAEIGRGGVHGGQTVDGLV